MVRSLFAPLAVSLLAACAAQPAGEAVDLDLLPTAASGAALSGCPQESCQEAEPGATPDDPTSQGDQPDMSNEPYEGEQEDNTASALPSESELPGQTQIPVDSRLRFVDTTTNEELLKVAISGSRPPLNYAPNTEYWSRLRPVKASVMSMESVAFPTGPGTPEYEKDFHLWLSAGSLIATAQETSPQQWIEGVYQPQSWNSTLYWAVDPDDPNKSRIGLLLERDGNHELLSMTWYKTWQPKKGLIFEKLPSKLKFVQVAGTEPRDIDPNAERWYYFHCVTRPL